MARKLARKCDTGRGRVTQDGEPDEKPNGEADKNESDAGGLLNRRDYVKLTAAATGAVLASSGVGTAAVKQDDIEYERDGEEISKNEIVDRDNDDELEHILWIMGTGTTSTFDFTVDGDLINDPSGGRSCDDSISGSSAEDAVTSETAKFQFDGEISDFSLDGDAGVYLDDNQVDPELVGTGEDPVLPNWLAVDGVEDETSYQFSVTGNLYKSPDLGPVEEDDVINDGMVIGSVTDDVDGYRFSGDLTMLRVQGTADIQFDEV